MDNYEGVMGQASGKGKRCGRTAVGWSYTILKKMLDRLVENRAVKKSKSGKQKKVEFEDRQALCI
ncbi:MAG: hypothetical protein JXA81_00850 [Sedimentisphaerales bacterium]|nr:hypothetical protein [Sedimentisphaerales bacterium]